MKTFARSLAAVGVAAALCLPGGAALAQGGLPRQVLPEGIRCAYREVDSCQNVPIQ